MGSAREFLNSGKGRVVVWTGIGAAVLLIVFVLRGTFGDSEAVASSSERPFICAKTGETFTYTLEKGDVMPVRSPHSGENTGYPAEACFWTRDGQIKDEPTFVLLNGYAGKPEPTFCPDCDRLVVGLNPPPLTGDKPPPLRGEYRKTKKKEITLGHS